MYLENSKIALEENMDGALNFLNRFTSKPGSCQILKLYCEPYQHFLESKKFFRDVTAKPGTKSLK